MSIPDCARQPLNGFRLPQQERCNAGKKYVLNIDIENKKFKHIEIDGVIANENYSSLAGKNPIGLMHFSFVSHLQRSRSVVGVDNVARLFM